ncbi:hypothetical protein PC123_g11 [Phytophthora cactorum]|nr:hypothetical protein PC123_g11 [Phytophthora cactorum]
MAVLYSMSTKIYNAQQQALVEGNSLILYEGFRPHHVQVTVAKELSSLAEQDAKVMNGINTPPWGIGWFIVNGSSNHQVGYAIDVGLAKVEEKTSRSIGGFSITDITAYSEYIMPTSIHELSGKSSIFKVPVSSKNDLDWRTTQYNSDMTIGALLLHRYATESGLTPLASEWWHFNDLDARDEMEGIEAAGKFTLSEIESKIPQP